MNCPCCQQSVPDGSLWWVGIHLTHSEARMLSNMEAARPKALSADQILVGVYANKKSVVTMLCRLRAKIVPHGWTIANKYGYGRYSLQEIA